MLEVIDAQVHAWDHESARYPWNRDALPVRPEALRRRYLDEDPVTAEQLLHMMLAVGVDAAVLTSPIIYGDDHSYALDAAARYPERFGVVGPLSPAAPDLEERVRGYREKPGALAVRVIIWPADADTIVKGDLGRLFAAAQSADVPVILAVAGAMHVIPELARAFADLQLVIDHLGTITLDPSVERISMLPDLIALAEFDNIAVKCTEAPSLSTAEYPFEDLWPHLHRVLEAFGPERVMWGTDITQHFGELSYCEAVDYIRRTDELSYHEKELILGKSLRQILRWPAGHQR